MSQGRPDPGRHARGASQLEFLVGGIVIAILAGVLLQRLDMYRRQAEDAAVQRVVAVLRTALAARVAQLATQGRAEELDRLVSDNPMGWLGSPPPNYLGDFDQPDLTVIPPGHWYFDRKRHLLVYMLNFSEKFPQGISEARFYQVKLVGRNKHFAGSNATPAQAGVALVQVDG